jgi:hypothetical protein
MHLQDLIGLAQTVPARNVHLGTSSSYHMAICPIDIQWKAPHAEPSTFADIHPHVTKLLKRKPRGPRREAGTPFILA